MRRSFFTPLVRWLTVGVLVLLTGCSAAAPTPEPLEQITDQYSDYYSRYQREFQLGERPAGSPKAIAESFMRRYQPGPLPRVFEHSLLYDRHGVLLAELVDEGRRTWVPLDRISPYVLDAVIATEDASFFSNSGIDLRRVLGALLQNAQSEGVVSGASTITMQLARNLFFTSDRRYDQSLERKAIEVFLAQDLTVLLSKQEILEMYLNLVYFGQRAYGIEAAAQTYFGKSANALSQAEATLLAGLPQSPAQLDPINNFAAAKRRQRIVLDLLVRHGYLQQPQADALFAQALSLANSSANLPGNLSAMAITATATMPAPHFVHFVEEQFRQDLGLELGRTGLRLTTTLDLSMQKLGEEIVAKQVRQLQPVYNLSNAALVALKPPAAEILAMVGSADFNNRAIAGQVNVATSLRQPGSTVKAMLYAIAFNDNLISPASVLWDLPVRYTVAKIQTYIPVNYDRKFHGPVTVRTALANSYNVPAIKLIDAVGPDRMAQLSNAMGLHSLSVEPGRYGLPLTLGANEVSLLDLTTAYHTLADGGIYRSYRFVLEAKDGAGNPVAVYPPDAGQQVVSPQAAFMVSSILSDNEARKPAFGANSALKLSHPAAVKTGTSSSYRDNWTIGYTNHLVTGVWAGNSNGQAMRNATGITGAAPIWRDFMEGVFTNTLMVKTLGIANDDASAWGFVPPKEVVQRPLECPKQLYCPNQGEYYTFDWLYKMGRNGPAGDGIAMRDRVAPVYFYRGEVRGQAGVCSNEDGQESTYLTLPAGVGLLAPPALRSEKDVLQSIPISPILPAPSLRTWQQAPLPVTVNEKIKTERLDALNWSGRSGTALHLGPCRSVAKVIRSIYGPSVRTLVIELPNRQEIIEIKDEALPNLAAAQAVTTTVSTQVTKLLTTTQTTVITTTTTATRSITISSTVVATATPAPTPPAPRASLTPTPVAIITQAGPRGRGTYVLASLLHDNNCAGFYILGTVINEDGGPVAGVRVAAVDQWGNYSESISKSGASDYGRFDLPLDHRIRDFFITVMGDGNQPLSATVKIEHKGDTAEKCHHIVWKRR